MSVETLATIVIALPLWFIALELRNVSKALAEKLRERE